MNLFKKIADNSSNASLAHSMRSKRYQYFMGMVNQLNRPLNILDIGGTQEYWNRMGLNDPGIKITLLNLSQQATTSPNFISVVGDATNLSEYKDASFDIVYSNSVIEHLFTKEGQAKMAAEAKRVGKYHFIQTPNYFFPIEPHFVFPFFQFLPRAARVWLINNFNLGHVKKKQSLEEARAQVDEIRLLSMSEMKKLFPGSMIWEEKMGGLTKSLVAHNFNVN
ncbi:MAG TPA: methyltransferase domain-containing protein [Chitinophagaceae bacterium]|jgi:2-polyprenyl-3-methyl-5-hydroxy-6-metoxy-1,4-benzoquinol methylase|nr:methyltransferase domain-containing protein [Chitinophagaceae bacterium]